MLAAFTSLSLLAVVTTLTTAEPAYNKIKPAVETACDVVVLQAPHQLEHINNIVTTERYGIGYPSVTTQFLRYKFV